MVSVPVDANHGFTFSEPKKSFGVLLYMVSVPAEATNSFTSRELKFVEKRRENILLFADLRIALVGDIVK